MSHQQLLSEAAFRLHPPAAQQINSDAETLCCNEL